MEIKLKAINKISCLFVLIIISQEVSGQKGLHIANPDSIPYNIIELSDLNVLNIKLNDNEIKIINILGKPTKTEEYDGKLDEQKHRLYYYNNDILLDLILKRKDNTFNLKSFEKFEKLKTPVNIGNNKFFIGDSLGKFKIIYPKSYSLFLKSKEDVKKIILIGYDTKNGKGRVGCNLCFIIENGIIKSFHTWLEE